MKTSAAIIFEPDYYFVKEKFIEENYDVTHYFSLNEDLVGKEFKSNIIYGLNDLVNTKIEKIIVAIRFTPILKKVIQILLKKGTKIDDIFLLIDKPNYYKLESIRSVSDIKYCIKHDGAITCKIDNYEFLLSIESELYIVNEVISEDCYNFFIPYEDITVIDIGMNIGIASVYFAKQKNINRIYAYEPFLKTYNQAIVNFELNKVQDKVIPHQYGISNTSRTLQLEYDEYSKGVMSTYRDNSQRLSFSAETVSIQVIDIAEVFTSIINQHPNDKFVLKVDCEGEEYNILERLNESGLINRVSVFIIEWHNCEGKNLSYIKSILSQNNFIYHIIDSRNSFGLIFAINSGF